MGELNVRLQHAVIGEGHTTISSIPKKGEVVFNSTLDNCRIGNGNDAYNVLPDLIIPNPSNVQYYACGPNTILEDTLTYGILYNGNEEVFDINTCNHIMLDANTLRSNPSWTIRGTRYYPLTTRLPSYEGYSIYTYLRKHPYKTLKISVFSHSANVEDSYIGFFYFSTILNTWQLGNLRWCPDSPFFNVHFVNNTATDNCYYSVVAKQPYSYETATGDHRFGTTISITCVDPDNNIFLIE